MHVYTTPFLSFVHHIHTHTPTPLIPTPLTAQDCFAIGRQAYLNSDWDHTRAWMKEALGKFDDGGEGSEIDLGDVYDHLAYAEFQVRSNLVRVSLAVLWLSGLPDRERFVYQWSQCVCLSSV